MLLLGLFNSNSWKNTKPRHLGFSNFWNFNDSNGQEVELRHCDKFRRNRSNCSRDMASYRFFKMVVTAFWIFETSHLNDGNAQEGQTASPCQISSKSLKPQPTYGGLRWCVKKVSRNLRQELIRRWDGERELLYDDNIHVEASAYAHWTCFLITTVSEI